MYCITYKAKFEYMKKLSSDSIVYKRHDNNFDLDIYLVRLYHIIRFHNLTVGGLVFLIKYMANYSSKTNITKNNVIPINLRLQNWDDIMAFIDKWSLLRKNTTKILYIIIETQYSRLVDRFP